MAPGAMVTVSKCEKKSSGFMSVRRKTILYVRIRSCRRRLTYSESSCVFSWGEDPPTPSGSTPLNESHVNLINLSD